MRRLASSVFVLALLAVNLMGSIRYVLRFGEPDTSPTYSAVPAEYFIFWDVMIGLMALIVVWKTRRMAVEPLVAYLLASAIAMLCLLQAESFHVRGAARSIVLYGFFFVCIYSNYRWIEVRHIGRFIEFLAVFGLAFLAYQYLQYTWFGVLPAHSHDGQLIRYGSFYDDSLVLGILLPMFAGYFFNKYRNPFSLVLITAIVCLIVVLTGSMTAMAATLAYVVWSLRRRWDVLLTFLLVIAVASIYLFEHFSDVLFFKADSIEGHFEGWRKLEQIGVLTLSGLRPLDSFAESGFLLLLYNFGLPVLTMIVVLHFATLWSCRLVLRRDNSSTDSQAVAGAAEGLTFSVLLVSLNLPTIIIAPVYLLVVILSAIVMRQVSGVVLQTSPRAHTVPSAKPA